MANAAFNYPFNAYFPYLNKTSEHLPGITIPVPTYARGRTAAPDLMTAFGLKGQTRFLPVVMESLEYEAKFFKGSATLGSLGFESGQELLCVSVFNLSPTPPTTYNWHMDQGIEEDNNVVKTAHDSVSDGDMQLANLVAPVVVINGANAGSHFSTMSSILSPSTDASKFHIYHSQTKRVIKDAPLIAARFRSHVKSEDFLSVAEVVGN